MPDDLYRAATNTSHISRLPLSDWIVTRLPHLLPSPSIGASERLLTDADCAAVKSALRNLAGAVRSGDTDSADNERIDADLARAYTAQL
jgi:hypothetical protein